MGTALRALIIEDSAEDTHLLVQELRRGYDLTFKRVETAEEMTAALAGPTWDIVISDYALPHFSVPAALDLLKKNGFDLPFLIVSGSLGEEIAVIAMKTGAYDYIVKGNLKRLLPAVERGLREAAVRQERRQAEEQLRQSEERFRQLAENITEVFWMTNPDKNEMLYVSPGYEKIWGRSCRSLYDRPITWMDAIHPEDRERVATSALIHQRLGTYDEAYRIIRPDGSIRWIRDRAFPIKDRSGRVYRLTGIAEDITARNEAEEALRASKEFSENLIQTANVMILSLDPDGKIEIFNQAAEEMTGYTLSELQGKNWFEILVPKDRYPYVWEEFSRLTAGGSPKTFENPILTKSGEERYIMWQNNQVRIGGKVVSTISFGNDITERKQAGEALKKSEERLRMAISAARMYTWDWDVQTGRVIRSGHYQEVYGADLSVSDSNYFSFLRGVHPEDRKKVEEAVDRAVQGKAPYRIDFRVVRSDGQIRWLESQAEAYRGANGIASRMIGVTQDITERKQAEEMVEHLAFYDTVTDLPNRNNLIESLLRAIGSGRNKNNTMALILMDLDHFKEINDTLGHQRGDMILKEVGSRLKSVLFVPDIVARLGGDEFAVLLPKLAKAEDLDRVIRKIQEALHPPFMIEGLPIVVEGSMGIALCPEHGTNPDSLLQRADVALYAAKESGSGHTLYAPELDRHSPQRLAMMAELRQAIEQNHLFLHYQPKVSLKKRTVSGVEALVRWRHPLRGMIPPDQFIGLAERSGLIHPLTHSVLQMAMRQCALWRQAGFGISVSVNLSARNLVDPNLPETVSELLRTSGVTPDLIRFEITESAIITDPARAQETLINLHRLGIGLSIDDFGTGYSSLSYLRDLPVDRIKVDKSFVMKMIQKEGDEKIVRSTIDLAHNLGLDVVAEGVETQEILDRLTEMGCEEAQGYFISRPLPAEELTRWFCESPWGRGGN